MSLPSITIKPGTHVVADPDTVPDTLPITKRMHERILTEDGINPQGRTTRAILAAIQELETALTYQRQDNT